MAFDGLFIHNLINEMKDDIIDKRINRFYTVNENDFLLTLSSKKSLFITLNPSNPYFAFTNEKLLQSNSFLSNYLKKHLEILIFKKQNNFYKSLQKSNFQEKIFFINIEKGTQDILCHILDTIYHYHPLPHLI